MAKKKKKVSIFEANPKLDLIVTIIGVVLLVLSVILYLTLPLVKINQSGLVDIAKYNGFSTLFGDDKILNVSYGNIVIVVFLVISAVVAGAKVKDKRFSLLGFFAGIIASIMIPFSHKMIVFVDGFIDLGIKTSLDFGGYFSLACALIGSLCLLAVSINANFDKYD